jgi:hypothetical protein
VNLEIDVRRVHGGKQALARLLANETRGDRDVLHAPRAASGRGVERVFHKDDRIVVGIGDARAAQALGGARDRLRRRVRAQPRDFAALGDVVVLAEGASEIAARRPERQHRRTGEEVI